MAVIVVAESEDICEEALRLTQGGLGGEAAHRRSPRWHQTERSRRCSRARTPKGTSCPARRSTATSRPDSSRRTRSSNSILCCRPMLRIFPIPPAAWPIGTTIKTAARGKDLWIEGATQGAGQIVALLQDSSRQGESSHPLSGRQVLRLGISQEPVDHSAAGQTNGTPGEVRQHPGKHVRLRHQPALGACQSRIQERWADHGGPTLLHCRQRHAAAARPSAPPWT